jgi:8-oxo-dGTP pyrophosphatase MutT (NUDIX family)
MNVQKLLNNKINKKYNDKIFWYASEVRIEENDISLYIDNSNLITFDNIDLNIKKISEIRNIKQNRETILKNVLVSSGSFLFINNKLAVTQRELTTTYDPGFWTTPAGRCDRTILETGIKETIEEIQITKNNKIIYPDLARNLLKNRNCSDIEFYNTTFRNSLFKLKIYNVFLYLDNELVEKTKSWLYFSKEVNTLEFRIPIFAELNEKNLNFTNPEFNTPTGLKTIEELKKLNCVPALKQLLKEIK